MRALQSLIVALAVGLAWTPARAAPCTLTAADIDSYLTQKKSPLSGQGAVFAQKGSAWNVDPRVVIAIAGTESTFGTHVCATNNAWNWFWKNPANCADNPFDTYATGIETLSKYIRLSYLNQGRTNLAAIGKRFCQSGCDSWLSNATQFYHTELGGDVTDLGCAPECAAASCSTFVECATPGASCTAPVCGHIAGTSNGQCVEGLTSCAGLANCTTSKDCNGGVCIAQSCCQRNVCVPSTSFCSSTSANHLTAPYFGFGLRSEGPTLSTR